MPAPTGPQIEGEIIKNLTRPVGPEGLEYIKILALNIGTGWATWQAAMIWGGLVVQGAGVGAWSGVGSGGTITAPSYKIPPFIFKTQTRQQQKLTDGISQAISTKFAAWVGSFKFSGVSYVGTSTATPIAPGTFQANNVSVPLQVAGTGSTPSGIATLITASLTPPDFNINNPQARIKEFVAAISKGVEGTFTLTWLFTAQVSANLVSGAAAPNGIGVSTSVTNGKVV